MGQVKNERRYFTYELGSSRMREASAKQRSVRSYIHDTVESTDLNRLKNNSRLTPSSSKRRPKRIESMKQEMKYKPEKEPFKVLPSYMKNSNLPKRMFMPKASAGDIFHWPGLIAPSYCLPEAFDIDVVVCPIFSKNKHFIRPVVESKDYYHDYPECRDRDLPSRPDKKGNPVEDHYIMNLFLKAADTEAIEFIANTVVRDHKKQDEKVKSPTSKVPLYLSRISRSFKSPFQPSQKTHQEPSKCRFFQA